jgi:hypothetical protein
VHKATSAMLRSDDAPKRSASRATYVPNMLTRVRLRGHAGFGTPQVCQHLGRAVVWPRLASCVFARPFVLSVHREQSTRGLASSADNIIFPIKTLGLSGCQTSELSSTVLTGPAGAFEQKPTVLNFLSV